MASRAATLRAILIVSVAAGSASAALAGPAIGPALERYREAHAALARGEFAGALARFEGLPGDFVLADYAAFFAAEALVRGGDEAAALERFREVPVRFPDSILGPDALLAAADTAFRLERWPEAESLYGRFLARAPRDPEIGRALVRLGEARAAQGLVAEAVAELRRRWIEAPATPWGVAAREVFADLASRHGITVAPLTPEERLLQAQRLIAANELTAAAGLLPELLGREAEAELRHRALARLTPVLGRLRRSEEGIGLLRAALAEPPTLWRPVLLYELARLHRRADQDAEAVSVLERLLAEHPDASVSPDAWLALARVRLELGEPEARETLEALIRAHPTSGAAAAAGWEVGWLSYRAGQFRDAALAFRQLAATSAAYRLAGLYWAARALEGAQEGAAASALYRDLASRVPNGYYGLLARRRIRGPAPVPVAARVQLADDPIAPLLPDPHFQKSRVLWSLGFGERAVAELESLGRERLIENDLAFGLAVAFAQIGEEGRSLAYLRRNFAEAAEAGAPGLTPRFWRLFYPFGYADVVRRAAARARLDPFFVAAVIREESSFDPQALSRAGAVGLMQLMPQTARAVAADAGLSFAEPAALWQPGVNIGLGTHYLGQLRARFADLRHVAAGYNAGPNRVERWLRTHRAADLEEFVDQIPFGETRAFVKRVYTSWHRYGQLYTGTKRAPYRGDAEATPRTGR